MDRWQNPETEAVADYLESPAMKQSLVRLVNDWNDLELLGIDLADQIQKMTTMHQPVGVDLQHVDWNQLADHYAEKIAAVGEDELTRRREGAVS